MIGLWVVYIHYMFQYKIRFKKNGKSLERFCDFNYRLPSVIDPDDPHRKNICRTAYIAKRKEFNSGHWILETINPPNGRGLVVEYNDLLYYAARHDVEIIQLL